MSQPPLRVCFVIPGANRSGGVRVTMEMANGLLARGHVVRLLQPLRRVSAPRTLVRAASRQLLRLQGGTTESWVASFRGGVETYRERLDEISFQPGEIVIAVGSLVVRDVAALKENVIRVRYCHGFTRSRPDLMDAAWNFPMPTLAVSSGLVEELARRGAEPLVGVVPNGVSLQAYRPESGRIREGVGTVYHEHDAKAPRETLELLREIRSRFAVGLHVFGIGPRPRGVARRSYERSPSVARARSSYARSRVWIVASRYEGFGLPLLEAMACGTPVVTTDHDGCAGLVIHGENGFVVPFGAWEELLGRVGELLTDDVLWERMAAHALETAGRFTWDRAVDRMERCLRALHSEKVGALP